MPPGLGTAGVHPLSVSASRTFVTNQLTAWGVAPHDKAHGRVADITLVTSELAGNATKFGSQDIEISLVAHGDHVQVAVTDNNPSPPASSSPARPRPADAASSSSTLWPNDGGKTTISTAKPSGRTSPCQPVRSSETAAPSPALNDGGRPRRHRPRPAPPNLGPQAGFSRSLTVRPRP